MILNPNKKFLKCYTITSHKCKFLFRCSHQAQGGTSGTFSVFPLVMCQVIFHCKMFLKPCLKLLGKRLGVELFSFLRKENDLFEIFLLKLTLF